MHIINHSNCHGLYVAAISAVIAAIAQNTDNVLFKIRVAFSIILSFY